MPQKNEVSIDEYIGTRSLISKDGMVYRAAKMPKTFNAESRSATFVMTDESIDSYGDIVRAKGCKLDRFDSNPICLLNHSANMILGTWSDVKRIVRRIEGTATLASEGTAPHVDMAYNLMSQGILRAASIGFMPLKVERRLDDNGEPMWCYDILEWEMYECSVVSVPANPAALAKSMKDGSMMARDLLEEVLDNYVKMPSGVIVAIKDIEAAHKAGGGEKTTAVVDIPKEVEKTYIVDRSLVLATETRSAENEDVSKFVGRTVTLKAAHPENTGWPFEVIKDAHGEVLASWIVAEGENKGVHALAVEFLTKDYSGMFRGIKAERFNVVENDAGDDTVIIEMEGDGGAKDIEALQGLLAKAIAEDSITVDHDVIEDGEENGYRRFKKVDGGAMVKVAGDGGTIFSLSFPVWSDEHAAAVLKRTEELKVKAAPEPEKAEKTVASVTVEVDTTDATEKMNALSALLDAVSTKIAKFFGSKAAEPEPVEPPAPPTAEAIETAKAKAAASRERLATKGLIEA